MLSKDDVPDLWNWQISYGTERIVLAREQTPVHCALSALRRFTRMNYANLPTLLQAEHSRLCYLALMYKWVK